MPLLLQFSIALFTGMVAATFVPPIRRSIPRPVEVLLWVALITACAIGLSSVTSENARNLTTSVVWATDQVINTILGLLLGGVGAWISAHRFLIATWLIIVAGGDLFALMLLRSIRRARVGQPRVRLGEWMEMPVPVASTPAIGRASSAPLLAVDRRLAAATMVLVAAVFSRTVDMSQLTPDASAREPGSSRCAMPPRICSLPRVPGIQPPGSPLSVGWLEASRSMPTMQSARRGPLAEDCVHRRSCRTRSLTSRRCSALSRSGGTAP